MTRIILIVSGKGGVGKTTLTSNLSYALADIGEDVVAIDTNLTTPNLGLHTGMHLTTYTLHDVLKGKVDINKAVYTHPHGFRIIPASMSINDLTGADPSRLSTVMMDLLGKADFILLDSSAGLGRETVSAMSAVDEVIVIVNPTMPSVVDALKTAELARKLGKDVIGIVVNRRSKSSHELSNDRIENIIEASIIAEIPEDENVAKGIASKQPVVQYDGDSPAAVEFRRLAHRLSGQRFRYRKPLRFTLLDRLVNWINR